MTTTTARLPSPTDETTLSSATHRRIDLQSPLDLSYLLNNARAAARAKIDLHLPLQSLQSLDGADGDEMRRTVERNVDGFLEGTFDMVKKGVVVNGIEGEKVEWGDVGGPEEFEPYDHDLAKRITSLHSTIEQLNLQLANTRREAAAAAAQQFQTTFTQQSEQIDAALAQQEQTARHAGQSVELLPEPAFTGRQEEIQRNWEGALQGLQRLQQGVGETQQRAEGAEKVVGYLEGR